MARRKNRPEAVRVKCFLSERLREIRTELYGERGGSEMARQLGVPIRTWYNYESGVTVPAEVLLRFMELTSVEPLWLLHGQGPRFRTPPQPEPPGDSTQTVRSLLRTALDQLERQSTGDRGTGAGPERSRNGVAAPTVAVRPRPAVPNGEIDAQNEWLAAERDGRCLVVDGHAMTPIVAHGARVAYAADSEPPEDLDGALVVAWVQGEPLVRWFRLSGTYGLLRAENPEFVPSIVLLDLEDARDRGPIRRVLWIGTPH